MATVQSQPQAAAQMGAAARRFLDSLTAEQQARATFEYMDGERMYWYYPPINRHGLALRDMDANQRELAMALLETGLTPRSYEQCRQIIEHEDVLGPLEKEMGMITFVRDVELYYFTIFGQPGPKEPWGWRIEGHHVSLHFSVWGDNVISVTPFFFGANPAEVRKGPKQGLRILGDREDLAFQLMESLDDGQQSTAIIYDEAPLDILTYNSTKVSFPFKPQGLAAADMTGAQKETLLNLVALYVRPSTHRPGRAEAGRHPRGGPGPLPPGLGRAGVQERSPLLPHPRRQLRRRVRQPAGRRQPHPFRLARHRKRLRRRRPARAPAAVPYPLTNGDLMQRTPRPGREQCLSFSSLRPLCNLCALGVEKSP